ncbi:hypothetical protein OG432_15515 [Streptomyces sp. NBC_00442]
MATVGLVASGVIFGAAPSASAANWGCPGSQVDSYTSRNSAGETLSHTYLFYSSASNGTDCAVTVAAKYAGKAYELGVDIWTSDWVQHDGDLGNYASYAGPVKITNTNGKCLNLEATVGNGPMHSNGEVIGGGNWYGVHCG